MTRQTAGLHIIVVEDNQTMREGLQQVLTHLGHTVSSFEKAEPALAFLQRETADLAIADYKLPGMNGIDFIGKARAVRPGIELVLITAFGSIELAVQAMQQGAADFITKPFSVDEIGVKIDRIAEAIRSRRVMQQLQDENRYLREEVAQEFNQGEIIGTSAQMQEIYKIIARAARSEASVIIYGESGTGKELVARALHKNSPRHHMPFIKVNCGALAEGIIESELFGHEKGAFTGALHRKRGRFELADHGTIFLDEIGEITPAIQIKLLRVLQEQEFERVGGEETLRVDVRIIAATNRDLQKEVEAGRFREDLYYRLHILPITLPPLRERLGDVPELARFFLEKLKRKHALIAREIDAHALAVLQEYHWPGNVRELENIIERAAVLCDHEVIGVDDLPPLSRDADAFLLQDHGDSDLTSILEKVERSLIRQAMRQAHGVKAEAARRLGIKTTTLMYKLSKYGLD